jgi:hypothetical protein
MIDNGTTSQHAPLSRSERRKFAACERTIKGGLKTFLAVGRALLCIRDDRLYREGYGTFDEYCEQKWKLHKTRAYQLMGAAQVFDTLEKSPPMVEVPMPENERQIRPLVGLNPDEQPAAWAEAVAANAGRAPSGSQVARVVAQYQEPEPEPLVVRYPVKFLQRIEFDPNEPEELADKLAASFRGEYWRRLLARLEELDHQRTS